jgi:hypothetical protein
MSEEAAVRDLSGCIDCESKESGCRVFIKRPHCVRWRNSAWLNTKRTVWSEWFLPVIDVQATIRAIGWRACRLAEVRETRQKKRGTSGNITDKKKNGMARNDVSDDMVCERWILARGKSREEQNHDREKGSIVILTVSDLVDRSLDWCLSDRSLL